jgi:hypothetical protein
MKTRILSAITLLLFITACNSTFEVGIEHSPAEQHDQAANPTSSLAPVADIPTQAAKDTPPSPTFPKSTDTQPISGDSSNQMVKIFMIALNDNGQTGIPVGCGDSAVPVMAEIAPTQAVLKAALESLLSVRDQEYGQSGLYNALYQSDLHLESVSIDGSGKAIVYLTGTLKMGGECDIPRVRAQVEQTVLQFPTVIEVTVYINGKPIAEVLSLKG